MVVMNMYSNRTAVDVICRHSTDGTLIPMRIRVKDVEGEYHIYNIKEYKFDVKKTIRLYYELNDTIWHMTY